MEKITSTPKNPKNPKNPKADSWRYHHDVYSEADGKTIASVRDPAYGPMLAMTPDMLQALRTIQQTLSEHPDANRGNSKVHFCERLAHSIILRIDNP
jgi:hypothetical protein